MGVGAAAAVVAGVIAVVVATTTSGGSGTSVAQGTGTASATAASGGGVLGDGANGASPPPTASANTPSRSLGIPLAAGPLHLVADADTAERISDLKKNLAGNVAYPDPQVGFYRVGPTGSYSVWLLAQNMSGNADFQKALGYSGVTGVMKQIIAGASMTDVTTEDPGPLGGALDCGKLSVGGTRIRSCTWVDRSSFGWVYFLSSVKDSKILSYTLDLRSAAEH
ncbi:hypothetical protein [Actinocrinis puniceicyclus]|uniref:hypothetical protein n=1 Tax=Actinocrinis puniceicyclus TaxID=977794 RepID=UPI001B8C1013|nr:hypothetical protein [Actinocrinis puniceicyclus]